jgi:hypothetical protein
MKPSRPSGLPPDLSPNFPPDFPSDFPGNMPPSRRPNFPSSSGQGRPPVPPPSGQPDLPDWPSDFPEFGPSDPFGGEFVPPAFRNRPSPIYRRPLPRSPYNPYNPYDRSDGPMMPPSFSDYRAPY